MEYALETTPNTLQTHPATSWNGAEVPTVPACNNQRREINFFKNPQQSEQNPSLGRICPESDFENVSDDVTSDLVDLNTCPANFFFKVFDTIHVAATEPMVASESMGTHLFSVSKNSKISENPKILMTSNTRKSRVP